MADAMLRAAARRLATVCRRIESAVAGRHPRLRPWHHQWLAGSMLYRDFRALLPGLTGSVLDVGCGDGPYRRWLTSAADYTGIDVAPGEAVDHVITPGEPWPLPDHCYDVVLCTQVLEHVADPLPLLDEIVRVAKPGATVLVSVPFIYNEHGTPFDFRRVSRHGVDQLLAGRLEAETVRGQGGVGSSSLVLILNWLELATSSSTLRLLARTALLPLWLSLCLVVNMLGAVLDRVDRTGLFYGNVLVIARTARA